MPDGSPVLDTLTEMTAVSIDHNSLSPRDYMVARLAALIAVDAPPISWYATAPAVEAMSKFGGTVLKTSLSKEGEQELQEALHGGGSEPSA